MPSLEDQAILNRVVVAEPLTHGRVGARELPIGAEKTHAVDHDIHVPDVFAMHYSIVSTPMHLEIRQRRGNAKMKTQPETTRPLGISVQTFRKELQYKIPNATHVSAFTNKMEQHGTLSPSCYPT